MGRASKASDRERVAVADVVRRLHGIFKTVDTFSREVLQEFGVTGPQLWALREIRKAGGLTIGELADRLYLHISTVSGILDRLEAHRLVKRERDAEDRRMVRLKVTQKGKGILAKAPEPPRSKVLRGVRLLPPTDVRRLRSALQQLEGIMEGHINSGPADPR